MRKLLCLLAILALTAPLFAGDLVLTVDDNGDGTFTVGYESYTVAAPVGIALEIDAGVGETISAQDLTLYDGLAVDSFFDVFVDFAAGDTATYEANADTATGAWLGTAHPLAVPGTTAGPATLPLQAVSLCMGSLVGTAPASDTLAMLTIGDGEATDCIIDVDTVRGGAVDVNGDAMTVYCKVDGGAAQLIDGITDVTFDVGSCVYPACWDAPTQCHGDSDGTVAKDETPNGTVDTVDWPSFRDSLFTAYPAAEYMPCSDYNRDGAVDTIDWPALRDNLFTNPSADCTPGDINGVYCP
jgi:hypothetical protein